MDAEIRDASTLANQALDQFEIEESMREDLYQSVKHAVKNASKNLTAGDGALSIEDERLMKKIELDFKRNGME